MSKEDKAGLYCVIAILVAFAIVIVVVASVAPSEYMKRKAAYKKAHPQGVSLDALIYRESQPPTIDDIDFVVKRVLPRLVLYANIEGVCYREGKIEIVFIDTDGLRKQKLFSGVAGEDTTIILNVPEDSKGWLLYYQSSFAHPSLVGLPGRDSYGIILHLPISYRTQNCE